MFKYLLIFFEASNTWLEILLCTLRPSLVHSSWKFILVMSLSVTESVSMWLLLNNDNSIASLKKPESET